MAIDRLGFRCLHWSSFSIIYCFFQAFLIIPKSVLTPNYWRNLKFEYDWCIMYHNRFLDVIKVSCVVIIIYLLYLFGLPSASSASTTIKQQPTNIFVRGKHHHRTSTLSISTSITNQTNLPAPKQTIREHNTEPWFFIKRGAGCFEIEISKNINIVIFGICKTTTMDSYFNC